MRAVPPELLDRQQHSLLLHPLNKPSAGMSGVQSWATSEAGSHHYELSVRAEVTDAPARFGWVGAGIEARAAEERPRWGELVQPNLAALFTGSRWPFRASNVGVRSAADRRIDARELLA